MSKPAPCAECGTLYHKKCCTDLTRDSRYASTEGLIRWYCKQCYAVKLKENEDTMVKEHLNDSPESENLTTKQNALSIVNWNAW